MAKKDTGQTKVVLTNVRAAFVRVYTPEAFSGDDGDDERKTFSIRLLMEKSSPETKALLAKLKVAANAAKANEWGDKESKWPKLKPDKVCLRDGDLEEWDGFPGNWYLSASAPANKPPGVVTNRKDKDGKWVRAEEGRPGSPYGGCYVNAVVRLWAQDSEKWGKRLNASLEAVQFLKDGEAFGHALANPDDEFTESMVESANESFTDEDAAEDDDSPI